MNSIIKKIGISSPIFSLKHKFSWYLVQMEQSVELNENAKFLEDLELLKTVDTDHLTNTIEEEDGPDVGLRSFSFGGSNPLEQLGLFMKQDEDEEEADPLTSPAPEIDIEEGEID